MDFFSCLDLNPHYPRANGEAMAEGFKKENPVRSNAMTTSRVILSIFPEITIQMGAARMAALLILAVYGSGVALGQTGSGWKPLYKDERDMKKQTGGSFRMVDGLVHVLSWGSKDLSRQPSADAGIRAKIHLRAETAGPTLYLRSNEAASTYYCIGFSGHNKTEKTWGGIQIMYRDGEEGLRFPGQYTPPKPLAPGDVVDVEFTAIGNMLTLTVNGQVVSTAVDDRLKDGGYWGVRSVENGYFSDIQVQTFPPGTALPGKTMPSSSPPATTTLSSGPQTDADKRIAALNAQFRIAYDREVGKPIAAVLAALDTSYVAALDRAMATATKANQLDDAIALREEKQRVTDAKPVPATDDAKAPVALKTVRATYRKQLATYEQQRAAKAQSVYDAHEDALDALQAAFTQQNKLDEALKVRTAKEEFVTTKQSHALPGANSRVIRGVLRSAPGLPAFPTDDL